MTIEQLADDVAAAIHHLEVEQVDIFGYSLGAAIALHVALRHPDVVRKLVLASVSYNKNGFHPGLMEGMENMTHEALVGSPWHDEYISIAPRPDDFATLFAKKTQMDRNIPDLSAEVIQAIKAPTLVIMGDSDIIRPEHAVELFRLLDGGVAGDLVGLSQAQLAILPGTTHVTVVSRADLLLAIIPPFLDAPVPQAT